MSEHLVLVENREGLETLFARSNDGPVLIFKHSLTCPISSAAYSEIKKIKSEVALVVVQKARDISREIETRTGVRHESPQAIVLRDGRAVWSDSHWGVTAERVGQALRDAERSSARKEDATTT